MIVNICGIPHKVIECEDNFNGDTHFGQITYKDCEIRINKDMPPEIKGETLCHEMVHGMLIHMGYDELSNDEKFVQAMGNAIYQGFNIKAEKEENTEEEVKDAIVARPKCMYCEFATLKAIDLPCWDCYYTANRPNFKPNESCKQLYSKIKEGMNEAGDRYSKTGL